MIEAWLEHSDDATLQYDVTKPTNTDSNYYLYLLLPDYGQLNMVIPSNRLTNTQKANLSNGELGNKLSTYLGGDKAIKGEFSRYRKNNNSGIVLRFTVTMINIAVAR